MNTIISRKKIGRATYLTIKEDNSNSYVTKYAPPAKNSLHKLFRFCFGGSLPFQNEFIFVDLLRSASVAAVCLDSESSTYSVPSKIFNAMAYGKPVLLIASQEAEISKLVTSNNVGIVIEPGNPRKVALSILKFKEDEEFRVRLSDNSLSLSDNFTKKNADLIINDWLS